MRVTFLIGIRNMSYTYLLVCVLLKHYSIVLCVRSIQIYNLIRLSVVGYFAYIYIICNILTKKVIKNNLKIYHNCGVHKQIVKQILKCMCRNIVNSCCESICLHLLGYIAFKERHLMVSFQLSTNIK